MCVKWDRADRDKTQRLCEPQRHLGGCISNYVKCVRRWYMIVFMEWDVGDDKVVDSRVISDTTIYNMVTNRKWDMGDGRMTSSVIVFSAINILYDDLWEMKYRWW